MRIYVKPRMTKILFFEWKSIGDFLKENPDYKWINGRFVN